MHPQCHLHGEQLPRVAGLVWQSLAVLQWLQQVCLLAGAAPSLSAAGTGQRKVLGTLGRGSLVALAAAGAARGPAPLLHRVTPWCPPGPALPP